MPPPVSQPPVLPLPPLSFRRPASTRRRRRRCRCTRSCPGRCSRSGRRSRRSTGGRSRHTRTGPTRSRCSRCTVEPRPPSMPGPATQWPFEQTMPVVAVAVVLAARRERDVDRRRARVAGDVVGGRPRCCGSCPRATTARSRSTARAVSVPTTVPSIVELDLIDRAVIVDVDVDREAGHRRSRRCRVGDRDRRRRGVGRARAERRP